MDEILERTLVVIAAAFTFLILAGDQQVFAQSAAERCIKESGNAAIAACDRAIDQNQNDAVLHFRRGYEWDAKGVYDKAIANYEEAIRLNPDYELAKSNLKLALEGKARQKQAETDSKDWVDGLKALGFLGFIILTGVTIGFATRPNTKKRLLDDKVKAEVEGSSDQLAKYEQLRSDGVLTEDEFEALKIKIVQPNSDEYAKSLRILRDAGRLSQADFMKKILDSVTRTEMPSNSKQQSNGLTTK